jgi:urease accessory protein
MAVAHGGQPIAGFASGVAHPLGGLDHVLAMVAVGLWAARCGGSSRWLMPAAFVTAMLAGGAAALAGLSLPLVELGIVGSVCLLGAAVAIGARPSIGAAVTIVGLVGTLHGYAHGAEIPAGAAVVAYGAGFALATASLHAMGLAIGVASTGVAGVRLARAGGGMIALAGLAMLAAL